jgi:hypothetical protein
MIAIALGHLSAVALLILALIAPGSLHAIEFDSIVVFGGSISDPGNFLRSPALPTDHLMTKSIHCVLFQPALTREAAITSAMAQLGSSSSARA